MKNIKFVDYKGNEIEGKWNEKFYNYKEDPNFIKIKNRPKTYSLK